MTASPERLTDEELGHWERQASYHVEIGSDWGSMSGPDFLSIITELRALRQARAWRYIDEKARADEQWLWCPLQHAKPLRGWWSVTEQSWMAHLGDFTIRVRPTLYLPLPPPPEEG